MFADSTSFGESIISGGGTTKGRFARVCWLLEVSASGFMPLLDLSWNDMGEGDIPATPGS